MAALTDEEGMALLLSSLGEDIAAGEEEDADGFSSQVKHVCTTLTHMVWPSTLILRTAYVS